MDYGSNHQSVLSGFKLQLLSDSFDIFIKKSERAAAPEMFSEIWQVFRISSDHSKKKLPHALIYLLLHDLRKV